jgi:hypothetical protein
MSLHRHLLEYRNDCKIQIKSRYSERPHKANPGPRAINGTLSGATDTLYHKCCHSVVTRLWRRNALRDAVALIN